MTIKPIAKKDGDIKLLAVAVSLAIMLGIFVYAADVTTANGDTRFTLLVSQSLYQNHSIKLDTYMDVLSPDHYALRTVGGHYYDYYPMGTSLAMLPAVIVANRLGMDLTVVQDSAALQRVIVSIVIPSIFLLLFLIGRRIVPDGVSLIITLVSFLGSALISTLGTSIWSHDLAILLACVVLYMLIAGQRESHRPVVPYAIGVLLFLCYLTRPTFSLFCVAVLAYLFFTDRNAMIKVLLVSASLLAGLVVFSLGEYGSYLPPYYMLETTGGNFPVGLYVWLVSPSRGLFVYSPFLLAVLAGATYVSGQLRRAPLFLMALGWMLAHLLISANWPALTASHSFGTRRLVDAFPAYIIVTFCTWNALSSESVAARIRRTLLVAYVLLGLAAFWINTCQGLLNPWTVIWNDMPPVESDEYRIVTDWKHPQVLSSRQSVINKMVDQSTMLGSPVTPIMAGTLANMHLGAYYQQKGDLREAAGYYDRAIETKPDSAEAYYYRGLFMDVQMKQYEAALEDYSKAIELRPSADVLRARGAVMKVLGRYNEALDDFTSAIALSPSDAKAHYFRGMTLYAMRRYREARADFARAITLNPDNEEAMIMMLNILEKEDGAGSHQFQKALARYVEETPRLGFTRMLLMYSLSMDDVAGDGLIAEAKKAISYSSLRLARAYYYIGESHLRRGDVKMAAEFFRKSVDTGEVEAHEYHNALSLLQMGLASDALGEDTSQSPAR